MGSAIKSGCGEYGGDGVFYAKDSVLYWRETRLYDGQGKESVNGPEETGSDRREDFIFLDGATGTFWRGQERVMSLEWAAERRDPG